MALNAKDGGTWKPVSKLWVKDGGTWKEVQEASVRDGGVWKQFAVSCVVTVPPVGLASCFTGGTSCTANGTVDADLGDCPGYASHTFLWTVVSNPGGLSFSGTGGASLAFSKTATATSEGDTHLATVELFVDGATVGTVDLTTTHNSF
jgi:hypothetical protein